MLDVIELLLSFGLEKFLQHLFVVAKNQVFVFSRLQNGEEEGFELAENDLFWFGVHLLDEDMGWVLMMFGCVVVGMFD